MVSANTIHNVAKKSISVDCLEIHLTNITNEDECYIKLSYNNHGMKHNIIITSTQHKFIQTIIINP